MSISDVTIQKADRKRTENGQKTDRKRTLRTPENERYYQKTA